MNNTQNKLLVLVVDDQDAFLQAVVDEIQFHGFEAMTAKNGLEGLEQANKSKFDLILSDIRMPNKDGQWFLSELRKTQKCFPPFIFMTGFADLSIQDAYSMGADGFLGKPLNPEKLEIILEKICLPLEKRWSAPPKNAPVHHISKNFSCSYDDQNLREISFGRGGMYLGIEKLAFEIGDSISFKFEFSNGDIKKFEGSGNIVWKKENPDGKSDEYGLYFEYLSPDTMKSWINNLKNIEKIEVIPNGK
ncbi:response regulator [Silvanigrella paludirubra]|uniref:Response regulator n=1 Tax=Silvanigrella paludirubra TaxID=2499159 RepID=A0A6N6VXD1_9BACT|nr:response regulator [Silvanigrella paludirubra]KAB8040669.1 response regulator [Silvanigrella paludirubra]